MATTTTNYGLTKPGYSDAADIEDINDNMDAIDNALDAKDRSLAVVNTGDTAEANIAKGELVYVRGHTTLADGLYQASAAITSGASLSGSNLTSTSVSDQIANVESVAAYFRVFVVSSKTTFTVTFPAHTSNMYVLLWNNEAPEGTRRLFTNVSIRADGSINYKGDIGSDLTITTNTNQMTIKYTSDRSYTFCMIGPDRTFMNGITIT